MKKDRIVVQLTQPRNPVVRAMVENPGAYRQRVVKPRKGKGSFKRIKAGKDASLFDFRSQNKWISFH